ncbi:DUF4825 domain-containing protein [Clostridium aestuarii]|uniref:DUF4825 domain-containing protein n=1 Tax=Clostridium aestuarii TaxID=338193 RepID=A0ABT4D0Y6_9CLOT|nr:DUF4825 domain-containing protein [Clostridium aestuarii]MCY6484903.1 DUF4825 domain-containing protein [Clostridium aestuarii]
MKKIFALAAVLILIFSFYVNAKSNKINKSDSESIQGQEINISRLLDSKNTYVGNINEVSNILWNLPGDRFKKGILLQTKNEPYGIEVNYGLNDKEKNELNDEEKAYLEKRKKELNEYWTDENTKKVFLNNATTLFILVKNVDRVKFNLDAKNKCSFSISRKELEEFYGKDLRKYVENIKLWEKEVLENTINSDKKIEGFFKSHEIICK